MIYQYERACREAGLDEKQIREIYRVFDQCYAGKKREEVRREKYGFSCALFSAFEDKGYIIEEIEDPLNIEEYMICKERTDDLRHCLDELSEEDREFLLACFEAERGAEAKIARTLGWTREQVRTRKRKLIRRIREQMSSKYHFDVKM